MYRQYVRNRVEEQRSLNNSERKERKSKLREVRQMYQD